MKVNQMVQQYLPLAALLTVAAVSATPAFAQSDDYCREFTNTITIGGKTQKGWGTACLQPDGSWQIVKAEPDSEVADAPQELSPPDNNIAYMVDEDEVYFTPPQPFVYGTVFIDGHDRHFNRDFHPRHAFRHHR